MAAAYDSFDYPSFWVGREYEHKSEILAIKAFFSKIRKIKTILELGAGFGRLTPSYIYRAKKIILSDPSAKSLKIARETFKKQRNVKYIHSSIENLPKKIRSNSIDVIIMVRVIHHISDVHNALRVISKMVKPGGYFILEFANKRHIKATIRNLKKGNLGFLKDTETLDIRSQKSIKIGTLPFLNYHPEKIWTVLNKYGFTVIEARSGSKLRNSYFKKLLSIDILLLLEKYFQRPFSRLFLGPSIFILARKKG
jgi:ubiquinone/menaquinone biosynthesis C-methylase UbiE